MAKINVPLTENKSGLLVPEDSLPPFCPHEAVIQRVALKPRLDQYVCHDCGDKVLYVVLTWAVMTPEEFKTFQVEMGKRQQAAKNNQKRGKLIVPGKEN